MKTFEISNERITGKPRNLNVTLNNVSVTYSVDLVNTDGSMINQGINKVTQLGLGSQPGSTPTEAEVTAKNTFLDTVTTAFEAYWSAIQ